MNSSISKKESVKNTQSQVEPLVLKTHLVGFLLKNPDLDTVYNSWSSMSDTETEKPIRKYLMTVFEAIYNKSKCTKQFDPIYSLDSMESPTSLGSFLKYGDEIESFRWTLEDALKQCMDFETNHRTKWEKNVNSLRYQYNRFMMDWIERQEQ
jgi:hypothetical protein